MTTNKMTRILTHYNTGSTYTVIDVAGDAMLLVDNSINAVQPFILAAGVDELDGYLHGWSYGKYYSDIFQAYRHFHGIGLNDWYNKLHVAWLERLEDGTYFSETFEPKIYDDGFQVSFITDAVDNLRDEQFNAYVNGVILTEGLEDEDIDIGVYENNVELSIWVYTFQEAREIGNRYNQKSVWDWSNMQEIEL